VPRALSSVEQGIAHRVFIWILCRGFRCDLGCWEECTACMRDSFDRLSEAQLSGVLHASGVLRDATLLKQSPALIRTVWAPKAAGATRLQAVGRDKQTILVMRQLPGRAAAAWLPTVPGSAPLLADCSAPTDTRSCGGFRFRFQGS
jgi:KR domain